VTASPLLEVQQLGKRYRLPRERLFGPPATVLALAGLSFKLHAGRSLGIVGESGSGKSTLARLVMALEQPTEGRVLLNGQDLHALPRSALRAARAQFQMVFQDPYGSLDPRRNVGRIVAEPLDAQRGLSRDERRVRVGEALDAVGLRASDAGKYPHEFSGGQRQRIAIARALITRPALIVADEPVSALDVSVQAQVLNLMKDLQRERGLTYLFISHNLAVVRHVADRVGVLYLGRLAEIADKAELFARPRHPYTRMLLDAIPDVRMSGRARTPVQGEVPNPLAPPAGCAFHPRCPHANARCSRERPALLPYGSAQVACHAVEEGRLPS
jgi:peptide/nickel transport system ATP-binding protein